MTTADDVIRGALEAAAAAQRESLEDPALIEAAGRFAEAAVRTLESRGRLFACGNGGSMADAMHFAEEWTGRFRGDRRALPAMAFSDPVTLSCIANDFGWEEVFARQVETHGQRGDLLLAISTSGDSTNVLRAVRVARELEMVSVGLLGRGGGKVGAEVDIPILVPMAETSDRIQEIHIQLIHAVIEAGERVLFPSQYPPGA